MELVHSEFFVQSQMCSGFMIVTNIIREQLLQMAFIEGNDVIQQITPAAFHPSLSNIVLPGTFKEGSFCADLHRSNCCRNF